MDVRKALPAGAGLSFPGMNCTVEAEIGRGSNAIVYHGWYYDLLSAGQRHHVLIKELFPYQLKAGPRRGDGNEILWDEQDPDAGALHRLSFERGNDVHLRLLEKYPDRVGANLNTFSLNGTLYTVLGFSGGRSLEAELSGGKAMQLKQIVRRMTGLLDALRIFHESGYMHLDVSPDNVLLIGDERSEQIVLIDFNSVHSLQEIRSGASLYYSTKEGYTAPEVQLGRLDEIGPAADLYSAAAVFFRMLTGAPLSTAQALRRTPPEVDGCPALQGMSGPVLSMVRRILHRGLAGVVRRRYAGIDEMYTDLRELSDRIDGVGVTHWALWEAGKQNVARMIRMNPSLGYIREADRLYPLRCRQSDGAVLPVQQCVEAMMAPEGRSALLTAPGGMGKTTSLLCAVEKHVSRFSPSQTAVVYVPLYGWKHGRNDCNFIRNKILEDLRFGAETASFDDARHALGLLMQKPLETRGGSRPVLLVLLDGLNEAEGDAAPLIREILELSRMEGVRLLVTTRTDAPELPFDRLSLEELGDADVAAALSEQGLLPPESQAMRELLRTPLMLSVFIQTALSGEKQLQIQTKEELMQAYFSALLEKEMRGMPENSPERWQIGAAVDLVLPGIAAAMAQAGGALDDQALLPGVKRSYRIASSRNIAALHPEWIGRSRDIRGKTAAPEEWYGLMVHDLLWQRLGLLVRDEQGRYRVTHQIIGEYLCARHRQTARRLSRRRLAQGSALFACLLALVISACLLYQKFVLPQPYSQVYADAAFDHAVSGYAGAASLVQGVQAAAEAAISGPDEYEIALAACRRSLSMAGGGEIAAAMVEKMLETGEVMPWSGKPFDSENFELLLQEANSRPAAYADWLDVLDFVVREEAASGYYPEYPQLLLEVTRLDAEILAKLYSLVCLPQMSGLQEYDALFYENCNATVGMVAHEELYSASSMTPEQLEGRLAQLFEQRRLAEDELNGCAAAEIYRRHAGNN